MSMSVDLTVIVENILKNISKKTKYKGYVLEESLIAFKYLKDTGLRKTIWWKSFLKLLLGFFRKIILYKKVSFEDYLKKDNYRLVVAINFSIADTRHSKILIEFINKFPEKKDLLIITNHRCVAQYCFSNDFSYAFFKPTVYNFSFCDLFNGYNINESFIFKEYREYINFLSKLYVRVNPKLVITTQDFLIPDFYFAKVAKSFNIKTITHQHGEIPNSEKSLYSVLFSDYFMCWGVVSKERLIRSLNPNQIKVVGTTKFNYINHINNKNGGDILITPTVMPLEEFKHIFDKIIIQLKDFETVKIKVHPSQDIALIEKTIQELCILNKIFLKVQVVGNNESLNKLLNNAFVMINIKSGAYLEGILSGTSLIELDIDGLKRPLSQNSDALIKVSDLKNEILKRKLDSKYNDSIIRNQNLSLKKSIFSSTLETEIEFVKTLLLS